MFPLKQYIPEKAQTVPNADEKGQVKKGRRDRDEGDGDGPTQGWRVIAPEVKEDLTVARRAKKLRGHSAHEGIDDLDLLGRSLIEDDEDQNVAEKNVNVPGTEELALAVEVSKMPIQRVAQAWNLAPFLIQNLEAEGFKSFFPIQALSIPDVVTSERHPHIRAQDVCITAPTGSGKTLSYVLPILNALANRVVRRLRALVVLPSRDLAQQVYDVFRRFCQSSNLRVGLVFGQSDLRAEQRALTIDPDLLETHAVRHQRRRLDPGNLSYALGAFGGRQLTTSDTANPNNERGLSAIDILVCTPGRLVDHLDNTPGFSLEHLRFLVIDEADRLLSSNYQNWLQRCFASAKSTSMKTWERIKKDHHALAPQLSADGLSWILEPVTFRHGGASGDDADFNSNESSAVAYEVVKPVQLRKFIVSATMTRDPQKLTSLRLVNPKSFDVHQLSSRSASESSRKFSMPASLEELMTECKTEQKPLFLFTYILSLRKASEEHGIIVVFTGSVDSTHRLARLLQLLWHASGEGETTAVVEFSSALSQEERFKLIDRCKSKTDCPSIVVCSDGMSRGMDLPDVSVVVNYDIPKFAKTLVHRCGRTARAGRKGVALSLVKTGQRGQFRRLRQLIREPERVGTWEIDRATVRDYIDPYRKCLGQLKEVLEAENSGDLGPVDPIAVS